MSRKLKGTTMSLSEFNADVVSENLLPTESKGLDMRDVPRFGDRGGFRDKDRRERRDNVPDSGFRRERTGPQVRNRSRESDRDKEKEVSRADEDGDWRQMGRTISAAPSSPDRRKFVPSSSKADESSSWRDDGFQRQPSSSSSSRPQKSFNPFTRADESENWRSKSGAVDATLPRSYTAAPSYSSPEVHHQERPAVLPWSRAASSHPPSSSNRFAVLSPATTGRPPADSPVEEKVDLDWGAEDEEEEEVVPMVEEDEVIDKDKLDSFRTNFEKLLSMDADEKKFLVFSKKVGENFLKKELRMEILTETIMSCLCGRLRRSSFDKIISVLKKTEPLFSLLKEESSMSHADYEYSLVLESQKMVMNMGYPRISPDCSFLEALWLGFYESGIIADGYFLRWASECDNRDTRSLFQTQQFRDWLSGNEVAADKASESKLSWGVEDEEEDVDAELNEFLHQTHKRPGTGDMRKKVISKR